MPRWWPPRQITTLNNMPVSFFVQSLIPVFQSNTVLGNGGQTIVTSTINPIQVQTGLSFVARINGDESLTVFGSATNYVLGAAFTDPSGNSFPNITTQTTPIQRIIRNGDTMVIGGLNQKNDVVNTLKVPLLGDLPFIGNMFRSRSVTTDDKELLIFVTPSILPERVSTAAHRRRWWSGDPDRRRRSPAPAGSTDPVTRSVTGRSLLQTFSHHRLFSSPACGGERMMAERFSVPASGKVCFGTNVFCV